MVLPLSDAAQGFMEPLRETSEPRYVTAREFISASEEMPAPLVGTEEECVIAAESLVIIYGTGGAGKTTLALDFLRYACSGCPEWLGLNLRSIRALVIENDGPRVPFRVKLKVARDKWSGPEYLDSFIIRERPWGDFNLAEEGCQRELAGVIDAENIDMVVVGPLASVGATGGGTPDDVTRFAGLVRELRGRTCRPFALVILHHENKARAVSGAWERLPDTLIHLQHTGNGRAVLHWEKVRWSSKLHQQSWSLRWSEDGGFLREEGPARNYKSEILEALQDGKWRPLTTLAKEIRAGQNTVREILEALAESGDLEFKTGAPGFKGNAKCYRLACPTFPDRQE